MVKTPYRSITDQHRAIVDILAQRTTPALAELLGDQIAEKLGFKVDESIPAQDAYDIYTRCRGDGSKWAAEFVSTAKQIGAGNIDEGWMIGWFCNAMECAKDVERSHMREAPLEVGDAVVLKSGGPNMLVRAAATEEHLVCHWVDSDGSLSTATFSTQALVRVAPLARPAEDGSWSAVA